MSWKCRRSRQQWVRSGSSSDRTALQAGACGLAAGVRARIKGLCLLCRPAVCPGWLSGQQSPAQPGRDPHAGSRPRRAHPRACCGEPPRQSMHQWHEVWQAGIATSLHIGSWAGCKGWEPQPVAAGQQSPSCWAFLPCVLAGLLGLQWTAGMHVDHGGNHTKVPGTRMLRYYRISW